MIIKEIQNMKFRLQCCLGAQNYQVPKSFYHVPRDKDRPTHLPLIKVYAFLEPS